MSLKIVGSRNVSFKIVSSGYVKLNLVSLGALQLARHLNWLSQCMVTINLPTFLYFPLYDPWRNVGIKNDFSAQLHKFLANLTDTRWKLEGKTVMYIPTEGLKHPAEEAAKNKDLVQRLESKSLFSVLKINLFHMFYDISLLWSPLFTLACTICFLFKQCCVVFLSILGI